MPAPPVPTATATIDFLFYAASKAPTLPETAPLSMHVDSSSGVITVPSGVTWQGGLAGTLPQSWPSTSSSTAYAGALAPTGLAPYMPQASVAFNTLKTQYYSVTMYLALGALGTYSTYICAPAFQTIGVSTTLFTDAGQQFFVQPSTNPYNFKGTGSTPTQWFIHLADDNNAAAGWVMYSSVNVALAELPQLTMTTTYPSFAYVTGVSLNSNSILSNTPIQLMTWLAVPPPPPAAAGPGGSLPPDDNYSSGLTKTAKIGLIVGGAALFLILMIITGVVVARKRRAKTRSLLPKK